jgi:hypothetical protein
MRGKSAHDDAPPADQAGELMTDASFVHVVTFIPSGPEFERPLERMIRMVLAVAAVPVPMRPETVVLRRQARGLQVMGPLERGFS